MAAVYTDEHPASVPCQRSAFQHAPAFLHECYLSPYPKNMKNTEKVPDFQQKVIHEPGTSAISKNIPLSEAHVSTDPFQKLSGYPNPRPYRPTVAECFGSRVWGL